MGLSPQAWAHLLAAGFDRRFEPGDVLLRQGDPGTHVLAVVSGRVKVVRTSSEGDLLVMAIRAAGDILGEMSVLGVANRSATAIAVDRCATKVIRADRFLQMIQAKSLEGEFLRHAMARIREGEEWREELASLPAGRRLARTLLQLLPTGPGMPLDVALSQSELGQAAGLARSTVAAQLARLRELGAIDTGRGRILVTDLARLRAVAGGIDRNV
jgi:CRP/FNR family transcriptional regulator, cyclic AMP receptor protein